MKGEFEVASCSQDGAEADGIVADKRHVHGLEGPHGKSQHNVCSAFLVDSLPRSGLSHSRGFAADPGSLVAALSRSLTSPPPPPPRHLHLAPACCRIQGASRVNLPSRRLFRCQRPPRQAPPQSGGVLRCAWPRRRLSGRRQRCNETPDWCISHQRRAPAKSGAPDHVPAPLPLGMQRPWRWSRALVQS